MKNPSTWPRPVTLVALALLCLSPLPAVAQEYWAELPAKTSDAAAARKSWTQAELDLLLKTASRDDGPTGAKVAALDELAEAIARQDLRPAGLESSILKILARPEAEVPIPASRIAGMLKIEKARSELESWATSANTGTGVAALRALVSLGGKESLGFLRKLYAQKSSPRRARFGQEVSDEGPLQRANIICALIDLDPAEAANDVVAHFSSFPDDRHARHIFKTILSRKDGPTLFAKAIKDARIPATAAKAGIKAAGSAPKKPQTLIDALKKAGGIE